MEYGSNTTSLQRKPITDGLVGFCCGEDVVACIFSHIKTPEETSE